MSQKLFGLGIAGTGIVSVLIVTGIILKGLNIASAQGDFAISAGIGIGVILGLFGIFGVIKKLVR